MANILSFRGIIKNVQYNACMGAQKLSHYTLPSFDINDAKSYGIIDFEREGSAIGYSRWVSPKRTRSYPFARIYNTYHLPKKVTVIPIIKDEGINGDNDRINFITLSWMNLLNIYIILAWYDEAELHPKRTGKITNQKMLVAYIREKLGEISTYHQTALHWNVMHFDRDFVEIYQKAVQSYQQIELQTGTEMHSAQDHLKVLVQFQQCGTFSREAFKEVTLPRSYQAARRETVTQHVLEHLGDGTKGYFSISNMLGGEYHLTADEIFQEEDVIIIQESKNSKKDKLPKQSDILDGLFKLILFANMDQLYLGEQQVQFITRLKLTGDLIGALDLPASNEHIQDYAEQNELNDHQIKLLSDLSEEASQNARLSIQISANI